MTREDLETGDSKAPEVSVVARTASWIKDSPHVAILIGLIVLGAALRFSTLDLQSFRHDEAMTVGRLLQPSLFDTLSAVPGSESVPPLYYLVAWLWSQPFGTGEVGIRSLSALIGTGTILVVYLGAAALPLPRRAALMAAAIVAVSPALIWFSQDARTMRSSSFSAPSPSSSSPGHAAPVPAATWPGGRPPRHSRSPLTTSRSSWFSSRQYCC